MKKGKTTNALRLLQGAGIDFEVIEYELEIGEDFGIRAAEAAGIDPEISFKTLVAKGDKSGYIVACASVSRELDLKKLAKESGNKKAELIRVRDLPDITGYIRGGVSPIGMKKRFPTYIDSSCMEFEKIAVSGGQCGITVVIAPGDLIGYLGAKVCDISAK